MWMTYCIEWFLAMTLLVSILLVRGAEKYIHSHLDFTHLPVCVKIHHGNPCIVWTEAKIRKDEVNIMKRNLIISI